MFMYKYTRLFKNSGFTKDDREQGYGSFAHVVYYFVSPIRSRFKYVFDTFWNHTQPKGIVRMFTHIGIELLII